MVRWRRSTVAPLVLLLLAVATAWLGGASLPTAAVGQAEDRLTALLPVPAAFGDGWVRVGEPVRLVPDPAFRAGLLVAYGGPAGARATLTLLLVTDDRVAIRAAWEAASKLYDRHRTDLAYEEADAEALAALPPPPGCAEAKRIEGPSERDTFPTGVILCAAEADPDLILLAVASGDVAGEAGHRAAEAVIAASLAAQEIPASSPAAAP